MFDASDPEMPGALENANMRCEFATRKILRVYASNIFDTCPSMYVCRRVRMYVCGMNSS